MTDVAFLAISQAHQFLHWLPAALRLSREPGVRVIVLTSTDEGQEFIRSFDRDRRLNFMRLRAPSFRQGGLFSPPQRVPVLLMNARTIGQFSTVVTTETTSSLLKRLPGFRSTMIHLKHGAGDREGGYNPKHAGFDLTLVNGPKDKQRLIDRGLGTDENIVVVGYGKFELIRPPTQPLFPDNQPVALVNPHFDSSVGTWHRHGSSIVRALETMHAWNFVVAPHVKTKGGPRIRSTPANILIDRGSVRSIDMTYTQSASVYIGDASSQVYEFIRTPRPCIFLNLDRREWSTDPAYSHWHFGQVIDSLNDLPRALAKAPGMQKDFEQAQRRMFALSIDQCTVPASDRQARTILDFAQHEAQNFPSRRYVNLGLEAA